MNFPLPDNRIANYARVSSFLPNLVCQVCHSLTLQQVICLKCQENICFKCIQIGDDQIPEPSDIPLQTIQITRTSKYIQDQYYRGICPICECTTILTSTIPKLFHKLYTTVKFQCINRVNGCGEELCYPDLRIHESKCGFNQMKCPKVECGQMMYRKDFLNHVQICDPTIECQCGGIYKEQGEHTEQSCLRNQCEVLKSQLFQFSSPTKKIQAPKSPHSTSPFSLQTLIQKSAQLMNE